MNPPAESLREGPALGRAAARALLVLPLAYALWWACIPTYNRVLAQCAAPVLRLGEGPWTTRLSAEGQDIRIGSSILKDKRTGEPLFPFRVPGENLHWNIFLFLTLALAVPGPQWRRTLLPLLALGLAILLLYHVGVLWAWTRRAYAFRLATANQDFAAMTLGSYTHLIDGRYVLTWRGPFYDGLASFLSYWASAPVAVTVWAALHWRLGRAIRRAPAA